MPIALDTETGEFVTVTEEEAEAMNADFLLCVLREENPGLFTDNLVGRCHDCAREVVYRPTSPTGPKKVCMECAVERLKSPGQQ